MTSIRFNEKSEIVSQDTLNRMRDSVEFEPDLPRFFACRIKPNLKTRKGRRLQRDLPIILEHASLEDGQDRYFGTPDGFQVDRFMRTLFADFGNEALSAYAFELGPPFILDEHEGTVTYIYPASERAAA
jgi:hypothetical protein